MKKKKKEKKCDSTYTKYEYNGTSTKAYIVVRPNHIRVKDQNGR